MKTLAEAQMFQHNMGLIYYKIGAQNYYLIKPDIRDMDSNYARNAFATEIQAAAIYSKSWFNTYFGGPNNGKYFLVPLYNVLSAQISGHKISCDQDWGVYNYQKLPTKEEKLTKPRIEI